MATSKDDKIMDVSKPGKAAPSPSSKPIIVTNRPMLKRDPMVATLDGLEKTAPSEGAVPVSRTAKTLHIVSPADQSGTAVKVIPASPAPDSSSVAPSTAPDTSSALPAPSAEATKDESVQAPAVDAAAPEPTEPAPATEQPTPTPDTTPATPAPTPDDSDDDDTDASEQLAPNQALEAAKQKEEAAKAARLAEEEKIVTSKQYYLPIDNIEERRGFDRVLLVLAIVLILALVWADVVLDAGIIHISGVHALTHFFSH